MIHGREPTRAEPTRAVDEINIAPCKVIKRPGVTVELTKVTKEYHKANGGRPFFEDEILYVLSEDITEPGCHPFFLVNIGDIGEDRHWLSDGKDFWPVSTIYEEWVLESPVVGELYQIEIDEMREAIKRFAEDK